MKSTQLMKSRRLLSTAFLTVVFSLLAAQQVQAVEVSLELKESIAGDETEFRPAALFHFADAVSEAELSSDDGSDDSFAGGSYFDRFAEGGEAFFYRAGSSRGAVAAGSGRCSNFEGTLSGEASYYGPGFEGRPTACGQTFTSRGLTAAIRQGQLTRSGNGRAYRCGSLAKVTNRENGRVIWVTLNDTGGLPGGRVIDLSTQAARELGFVQQGTTNVTVQICPAG